MVERVSGERPRLDDPPALPPRVERVRTLDVLLFEVLLPVGGGDVEALARDDSAFVERVLRRVAQRDELVVEVEVREREAGGPRQERFGLAARGLELRDEGRQFRRGRRAPEAAHADVHGVDLAPADGRDDLVAGLLQAQAERDRLGVVLRHVERALVAEEVGGVEHRGVEHVALDPLAAVEQAAQRAHAGPPRSAPHAASIAWTELIWYATGQIPQMRAVRSGASANARPLQERLEEARRLVDVEPDVSTTRPFRTRTSSPPSPSTRARAFDGRLLALVRTFLLSHGARSPCGTPRRPR